MPSSLPSTIRLCLVGVVLGSAAISHASPLLATQGQTDEDNGSQLRRQASFGTASSSSSYFRISAANVHNGDTSPFDVSYIDAVDSATYDRALESLRVGADDDDGSPFQSLSEVDKLFDESTTDHKPYKHGTLVSPYRFTNTNNNNNQDAASALQPSINDDLTSIQQRAAGNVLPLTRLGAPHALAERILLSEIISPLPAQTQAFDANFVSLSSSTKSSSSSSSAASEAVMIRESVQKHHYFRVRSALLRASQHGSLFCSHMFWHIQKMASNLTSMPATSATTSDGDDLPLFAVDYAKLSNETGSGDASANDGGGGGGYPSIEAVIRSAVRNFLQTQSSALLPETQAPVSGDGTADGDADDESLAFQKFISSMLQEVRHEHERRYWNRSTGPIDLTPPLKREAANVGGEGTEGQKNANTDINTNNDLLSSYDFAELSEHEALEEELVRKASGYLRHCSAAVIEKWAAVNSAATPFVAPTSKTNPSNTPPNDVETLGPLSSFFYPLNVTTLWSLLFFERPHEFKTFAQLPTDSSSSANSNAGVSPDAVTAASSTTPTMILSAESNLNALFPSTVAPNTVEIVQQEVIVEHNVVGADGTTSARGLMKRFPQNRKNTRQRTENAKAVLKDLTSVFTKMFGLKMDRAINTLISPPSAATSLSSSSSALLMTTSLRLPPIDATVELSDQSLKNLIYKYFSGASSASPTEGVGLDAMYHDLRGDYRIGGLRDVYEDFYLACKRFAAQMAHVMLLLEDVGMMGMLVDSAMEAVNSRAEEALPRIYNQLRTEKLDSSSSSGSSSLTAEEEQSVRKQAEAFAVGVSFLDLCGKVGRRGNGYKRFDGTFFRSEVARVSPIVLMECLFSSYSDIFDPTSNRTQSLLAAATVRQMAGKQRGQLKKSSDANAKNGEDDTSSASSSVWPRLAHYTASHIRRDFAATMEAVLNEGFVGLFQNLLDTDHHQYQSVRRNGESTDQQGTTAGQLFSSVAGTLLQSPAASLADFVRTSSSSSFSASVLASDAVAAKVQQPSSLSISARLKYIDDAIRSARATRVDGTLARVSSRSAGYFTGFNESDPDSAYMLEQYRRALSLRPSSSPSFNFSLRQPDDGSRTLNLKSSIVPFSVLIGDENAVPSMPKVGGATSDATLARLVANKAEKSLYGSIHINELISIRRRALSLNNTLHCVRMFFSSILRKRKADLVSTEQGSQQYDLVSTEQGSQQYDLVSTEQGSQQYDDSFVSSRCFAEYLNAFHNAKFKYGGSIKYKRNNKRYTSSAGSPSSALRQGAKDVMFTQLLDDCFAADDDNYNVFDDGNDDADGGQFALLPRKAPQNNAMRRYNAREAGKIAEAARVSNSAVSATTNLPKFFSSVGEGGGDGNAIQLLVSLKDAALLHDAVAASMNMTVATSDSPSPSSIRLSTNPSPVSVLLPKGVSNNRQNLAIQTLLAASSSVPMLVLPPFSPWYFSNPRDVYSTISPSLVPLNTSDKNSTVVLAASKAWDGTNYTEFYAFSEREEEVLLPDPLRNLRFREGLNDSNVKYTPSASSTVTVLGDANQHLEGWGGERRPTKVPNFAPTTRLLALFRKVVAGEGVEETLKFSSSVASDALIIPPPSTLYTLNGSSLPSLPSSLRFFTNAEAILNATRLAAQTIVGHGLIGNPWRVVDDHLDGYDDMINHRRGGSGMLPSSATTATVTADPFFKKAVAAKKVRLDEHILSKLRNVVGKGCFAGDKYNTALRRRGDANGNVVASIASDLLLLQNNKGGNDDACGVRGFVSDDSTIYVTRNYNTSSSFCRKIPTYDLDYIVTRSESGCNERTSAGAAPTVVDVEEARGTTRVVSEPPKTFSPSSNAYFYPPDSVGFEAQRDYDESLTSCSTMFTLLNADVNFTREQTQFANEVATERDTVIKSLFDATRFQVETNFSVVFDSHVDVGSYVGRSYCHHQLNERLDYNASPSDYLSSVRPLFREDEDDDIEALFALALTMREAALSLRKTTPSSQVLLGSAGSSSVKKLTRVAPSVTVATYSATPDSLTLPPDATAPYLFDVTVPIEGSENIAGNSNRRAMICDQGFFRRQNGMTGAYYCEPCGYRHAHAVTIHSRYKDVEDPTSAKIRPRAWPPAPDDASYYCLGDGMRRECENMPAHEAVNATLEHATMEGRNATRSRLLSVDLSGDLVYHTPLIAKYSAAGGGSSNAYAFDEDADNALTNFVTLANVSLSSSPAAYVSTGSDLVLTKRNGIVASRQVYHASSSSCPFICRHRNFVRVPRSVRSGRSDVSQGILPYSMLSQTEEGSSSSSSDGTSHLVLVRDFFPDSAGDEESLAYWDYVMYGPFRDRSDDDDVVQNNGMLGGLFDRFTRADVPSMLDSTSFLGHAKDECALPPIGMYVAADELMPGNESGGGAGDAADTVVATIQGLFSGKLPTLKRCEWPLSFNQKHAAAQEPPRELRSVRSNSPANASYHALLNLKSRSPSIPFLEDLMRIDGISPAVLKRFRQNETMARVSSELFADALRIQQARADPKVSLSPSIVQRFSQQLPHQLNPFWCASHGSKSCLSTSDLGFLLSEMFGFGPPAASSSSASPPSSSSPDGSDLIFVTSGRRGDKYSCGFVRRRVSTPIPVDGSDPSVGVTKALLGAEWEVFPLAPTILAANDARGAAAGSSSSGSSSACPSSTAMNVLSLISEEESQSSTSASSQTSNVNRKGGVSPSNFEYTAIHFDLNQGLFDESPRGMQTSFPRAGGIGGGVNVSSSSADKGDGSNALLTLRLHHDVDSVHFNPLLIGAEEDVLIKRIADAKGALWSELGSVYAKKMVKSSSSSSQEARAQQEKLWSLEVVFTDDASSVESVETIRVGYQTHTLRRLTEFNSVNARLVFSFLTEEDTTAEVDGMSIGSSSSSSSSGAGSSTSTAPTGKASRIIVTSPPFTLIERSVTTTEKKVRSGSTVLGFFKSKSSSSRRRMVPTALGVEVAVSNGDDGTSNGRPTTKVYFMINGSTVIGDSGEIATVPLRSTARAFAELNTDRSCPQHYFSVGGLGAADAEQRYFSFHGEGSLSMGDEEDDDTAFTNDDLEQEDADWEFFDEFFYDEGAFVADLLFAGNDDAADVTREYDDFTESNSGRVIESRRDYAVAGRTFVPLPLEGLNIASTRITKRSKGQGPSVAIEEYNMNVRLLAEQRDRERLARRNEDFKNNGFDDLLALMPPASPPFMMRTLSDLQQGFRNFSVENYAASFAADANNGNVITADVYAISPVDAFALKLLGVPPPHLASASTNIAAYVSEALKTFGWSVGGGGYGSSDANALTRTPFPLLLPINPFDAAKHWSGTRVASQHDDSSTATDAITNADEDFLLSLSLTKAGKSFATSVDPHSASHITNNVRNYLPFLCQSGTLPLNELGGGAGEGDRSSSTTTTPTTLLTSRDTDSLCPHACQYGSLGRNLIFDDNLLSTHSVARDPLFGQRGPSSTAPFIGSASEEGGVLDASSSSSDALFPRLFSLVYGAEGQGSASKSVGALDYGLLTGTASADSSSWLARYVSATLMEAASPASPRHDQCPCLPFARLPLEGVGSSVDGGGGAARPPSVASTVQQRAVCFRERRPFGNPTVTMLKDASTTMSEEDNSIFPLGSRSAASSSSSSDATVLSISIPLSAMPLFDAYTRGDASLAMEGALDVRIGCTANGGDDDATAKNSEAMNSMTPLSFYLLPRPPAVNALGVGARLTSGSALSVDSSDDTPQSTAETPSGAAIFSQLFKRLSRRSANSYLLNFTANDYYQYHPSNTKETAVALSSHSSSARKFKGLSSADALSEEDIATLVASVMRESSIKQAAGSSASYDGDIAVNLTLRSNADFFYNVSGKERCFITAFITPKEGDNGPTVKIPSLNGTTARQRSLLSRHLRFDNQTAVSLLGFTFNDDISSNNFDSLTTQDFANSLQETSARAKVRRNRAIELLRFPFSIVTSSSTEEGVNGNGLNRQFRAASASSSSAGISNDGSLHSSRTALFVTKANSLIPQQHFSHLNFTVLMLPAIGSSVGEEAGVADDTAAAALVNSASSPPALKANRSVSARAMQSLAASSSPSSTVQRKRPVYYLEMGDYALTERIAAYASTAAATSASSPSSSNNSYQNIGGSAHQRVECAMSLARIDIVIVASLTKPSGDPTTFAARFGKATEYAVSSSSSSSSSSIASNEDDAKFSSVTNSDASQFFRDSLVSTTRDGITTVTPQQLKRIASQPPLLVWQTLGSSLGGGGGGVKKGGEEATKRIPTLNRTQARSMVAEAFGPMSSSSSTSSSAAGEENPRRLVGDVFIASETGRLVVPFAPYYYYDSDAGRQRYLHQHQQQPQLQQGSTMKKVFAASAAESSSSSSSSYFTHSAPLLDGMHSPIGIALDHGLPLWLFVRVSSGVYEDDANANLAANDKKTTTSDDKADEDPCGFLRQITASSNAKSQRSSAAGASSSSPPSVFRPFAPSDWTAVTFLPSSILPRPWVKALRTIGATSMNEDFLSAVSAKEEYVLPAPVFAAESGDIAPPHNDSDGDSAVNLNSSDASEDGSLNSTTDSFVSENNTVAATFPISADITDIPTTNSASSPTSPSLSLPPTPSSTSSSTSIPPPISSPLETLVPGETSDLLALLVSELSSAAIEITLGEEEEQKLLEMKKKAAAARQGGENVPQQLLALPAFSGISISSLSDSNNNVASTPATSSALSSPSTKSLRSHFGTVLSGLGGFYARRDAANFHVFADIDAQQEGGGNANAVHRIGGDANGILAASLLLRIANSDAADTNSNTNQSESSASSSMEQSLFNAKKAVNAAPSTLFNFVAVPAIAAATNENNFTRAPTPSPLAPVAEISAADDDDRVAKIVDGVLFGLSLLLTVVSIVVFVRAIKGRFFDDLESGDDLDDRNLEGRRHSVSAGLSESAVNIAFKSLKLYPSHMSAHSRDAIVDIEGGDADADFYNKFLSVAAQQEDDFADAVEWVKAQNIEKETEWAEMTALRKELLVEALKDDDKEETRDRDVQNTCNDDDDTARLPAKLSGELQREYLFEADAIFLEEHTARRTIALLWVETASLRLFGPVESVALSTNADHRDMKNKQGNRSVESRYPAPLLITANRTEQQTSKSKLEDTAATRIIKPPTSSDVFTLSMEYDAEKKRKRTAETPTSNGRQKNKSGVHNKGDAYPQNNSTYSSGSRVTAGSENRNGHTDDGPRTATNTNTILTATTITSYPPYPTTTVMTAPSSIGYPDGGALYPPPSSFAAMSRSSSKKKSGGPSMPYPLSPEDYPQQLKRSASSRSFGVSFDKGGEPVPAVASAKSKSSVSPHPTVTSQQQATSRGGSSGGFSAILGKMVQALTGGNESAQAASMNTRNTTPSPSPYPIAPSSALPSKKAQEDQAGRGGGLVKRKSQRMLTIPTEEAVKHNFNAAANDDDECDTARLQYPPIYPIQSAVYPAAAKQQQGAVKLRSVSSASLTPAGISPATTPRASAAAESKQETTKPKKKRMTTQAMAASTAMPSVKTEATPKPTASRAVSPSSSKAVYPPRSNDSAASRQPSNSNKQATTSRASSKATSKVNTVLNDKTKRAEGRSASPSHASVSAAINNPFVFDSIVPSGGLPYPSIVPERRSTSHQGRVATEPQPHDNLVRSSSPSAAAKAKQSRAPVPIAASVGSTATEIGSTTRKKRAMVSTKKTKKNSSG